jgi:aminopeptidase N
VATPDFNMGAMENKGLNIFNSKYILCDEASATDTAILGVSRVVAHEFVTSLMLF